MVRASDGDEVTHWRRAGRFKDETVVALADLMFDDPGSIISIVGSRGELAVSLEFAARGRVDQRVSPRRSPGCRGARTERRPRRRYGPG